MARTFYEIRGLKYFFLTNYYQKLVTFRVVINYGVSFMKILIVINKL